MSTIPHSEILQQGVEAWNRWRRDNPDVRPDLSGVRLRSRDFGGEGKQAVDFSNCDLRGAHFERSILWGANFEGANLDAADFRMAILSKANFRDASLQAADLNGADLIDADFTGANLYKAALWDADLERSNLSNARSLSAEQLSGTRLFQTDLPAPIAAFPALRIVDELSKNARTLVVSMLGACAYCWLTILQTKDRSLIAGLDSTSAKLPIINVDLPMFAFYAVTPYILLGLYLYTHFTLSRLWSTISQLPAVFPGGEPLTSVVYSWLPPDVICRYVPRLRDQKHMFHRVQLWITVVLVWLSVPLTIALFWVWYLTAHEWSVTIGQIFLSAASAAAAAIFFRSIGRTLAPSRGKPVGFGARKRRQSSLATMLPAVSILPVFFFISYAALHVPEPVARQDETPVLRFHEWILRAVATTKLFRADLNARDFANSKGTPIYLAKGKLAYIDAPKVDFTGANISEANLRFGNLDGATFDSANMWGADLSASLSDNASFKESTLTSSRFEFAQLRTTDFSKAIAPLAAFRKATMENAKFLNANLADADFSGSILVRADFSGADLRRVNFTGADLTGANFEGAKLDDATLFGAAIHGTCFRGAVLTGVKGLDPRGIKDNAKDWKLAIYDREIIAALGLPPNHNQCDEMQRLLAQYKHAESDQTEPRGKESARMPGQ